MNLLPPTVISRRRFLKSSAAATAITALPSIVPSRLLGQNSPSQQIAVGIVGVGGMGQGHIDTLLGFPEVRILGICDVDRTHRQAAAAKINVAYGNEDCGLHGDFRELVARPDIDAVWVCTPDHWHALPAIEAVRRGKDVYVEKPLTLTIQEGRELVNAARRHGRVVQTGTQQRSSKRFRDVAEFIRNGGLGNLARIEVLIPANNKHCGSTWSPEPVPEGLDWNFWVGPAPWMPFTRQACHYNFRFIADYAAGQVTNWGTHYIDIAQWALGMDEAGPVEIEGWGEYPSSGLFTNATHVEFTCRYTSGVTLSCRTRYDGVFDGNVRFIGERGWVDVSRSRVTASAAELIKEINANASAGLATIKLPRSNNHHENFIQCIRSRERPISDVEIGHRTTTVCNLGNLAMRLGRKLRWDPARETFVDDAMANRMRGRSLRGPWSLA